MASTTEPSHTFERPLPAWLPAVLLLLPLLILGPFSIPHSIQKARSGAGLATHTEQGVPHPVISYVAPGSPADKLNLAPGTQIVAFDGHPTPDEATLSKLWDPKRENAFQLEIIDPQGERKTVILQPGLKVDFTKFIIRLLGAYYFLGMILLLLPQWKTTEGRILILLLSVLSTDFLLPYSQVESQTVNAALWRFNMWGITLAMVLKLHFILLFPKPVEGYRKHNKLFLFLLYGLMLPAGIALSMTIHDTLDPRATEIFFRTDTIVAITVWLLLTWRWTTARDQETRRLLRIVWLFDTPNTFNFILWHLHVYYLDLPWLEWYTWLEPLLLAMVPTGIFLAITRYNYLKLGKRLDTRLLHRFLIGMGALLILAMGQQIFTQIERIDSSGSGISMLVAGIPVILASTFLYPACKRLAYWMERGIFEPVTSLYQRFRNWLDNLPDDEHLSTQLQLLTRFIRQQLNLPWAGTYCSGMGALDKPHLFLSHANGRQEDVRHRQLQTALQNQLEQLRKGDASETWMKDHRIHTALPIHADNQPAGFLILGDSEQQPTRLTNEEKRDLRLIQEDLSNLLERKRLNQVASIDSLTGVMRREACLDALLLLIRQHRRNGQHMALAMADLDHFKRINDTWGHPVGDRVLAETAAILKSRLRSSDIVGRYGGEEFLLLFSDADEAGMQSLLTHLLQSVRQHPIANQGKGPLFVSMSAGCVLCAPVHFNMDDQTLAECLLTEADNLLYHSKDRGRDQFHLQRLTPQRFLQKNAQS